MGIFPNPSILPSSCPKQIKCIPDTPKCSVTWIWAPCWVWHWLQRQLSLHGWRGSTIPQGRMGTWSGTIICHTECSVHSGSFDFTFSHCQILVRSLDELQKVFTCFQILLTEELPSSWEPLGFESIIAENRFLRGIGETLSLLRTHYTLRLRRKIASQWSKDEGLHGGHLAFY